MLFVRWRLKIAGQHLYVCASVYGLDVYELAALILVHPIEERPTGFDIGHARVLVTNRNCKEFQKSLTASSPASPIMRGTKRPVDVPGAAVMDRMVTSLAIQAWCHRH